MPIYSYICARCGFSCDEFNKVDHRHVGPPHCGEQMKLDVTGPAVHTDLEPYFDDNLSTYVKSRQHRKSVMRDQGVEDKREYRGHKWRH
jgi:hypothetical protein